MRTVGIKIDLQDNFSTAITRAFANAKRSMVDLQKQSTAIPRVPPQPTPAATSSAMLGLGDIVKGNLIADALSRVAGGILQAGSNLVSSIGGLVQEADTQASQQLAASASVAATLNMSLKEAETIVGRTAGELAKSAVSLPGSTKDFLDSFNGISDTLSSTANFTRAGLDKTGKSIVEGVALMGQITKKGSQNTASVVGRLLSGNDMGIFQNDALQEFSALSTAIENVAKESGLTLEAWMKLDKKAKSAGLARAFDKVFTGDFKDRAAQSFSSQISTIVSGITDPQSGVLGFLREVKIEGTSTNVLSELGKSLSKVTAVIMPLFAGISWDPLISVITGIRGFTNSLVSVVGAIRANGLSGLMDTIRSGIAGIGGSIIGAFRGNEQAIGVALGNGFKSAVQGLGVALTGLSESMPSFVDALLGVLSSAFQIGVSAIGTVVSDPAFWGSLANGIAQVPTLVSTALIRVAQVGAGLIGDTLKAGFDSVASLIRTAIDAVTNAIRSLPGVDLVMGTPEPVKASYSGNNLHLMERRSMGGLDLGNIGSAYQGNLLDALRMESRMKPAGSSLVIANSSELIIPRNRIPEFVQPERITPEVDTRRLQNALNTLADLIGGVGSRGGSAAVPRLATISAF